MPACASIDSFLQGSLQAISKGPVLRTAGNLSLCPGPRGPMIQQDSTVSTASNSSIDFQLDYTSIKNKTLCLSARISR